MSEISVRFEPNEQGIADIAKSDEVIQGLQEVATEIAGTAYDIAPVDKGDYRESIAVETTSDGEVAVVASGRDVITDGAVFEGGEAVFVEYGSHGEEPYHVLTRAAETEGHDVVGGPDG